MLSRRSVRIIDGERRSPELDPAVHQERRENPELVSMQGQDAASKYSWMLIPLSVPFMWLLFPFRRRFNTYDHTVFVTYSLSFMMMLVVVGGLLVAAGCRRLLPVSCSSCRRSTCTGTCKQSYGRPFSAMWRPALVTSPSSPSLFAPALAIGAFD